MIFTELQTIIYLSEKIEPAKLIRDKLVLDDNDDGDVNLAKNHVRIKETFFPT